MAAAKKPITIRNLHTKYVHLRLSSLTSEKPYRIALKPRGLQGDCDRIPAALTESPEYSASLKLGLFEVIPESEAAAIEYAPTGYLGRDQNAEWAQPIKVVHNEETTIARIDESGKQVRIIHTGPNYVDRPGSDPSVTQGRRQVANDQPGGTAKAGEVTRPDAGPEAFQGLSPTHRDAQVTQPSTGRKPPNRNPEPQRGS